VVPPVCEQWLEREHLSPFTCRGRSQRRSARLPAETPAGGNSSVLLQEDADPPAGRLAAHRRWLPSVREGSVAVTTLLESRPKRADYVIAAFAFGLTPARLAGAHGSHGSIDPLGVLLAALASLPLVVWRRSPLGVFAFTAAASATINGLDYAAGPPFGPTI